MMFMVARNVIICFVVCCRYRSLWLYGGFAVRTVWKVKPMTDER